MLFRGVGGMFIERIRSLLLLECDVHVSIFVWLWATYKQINIREWPHPFYLSHDNVMFVKQRCLYQSRWRVLDGVYAYNTA